MGVTGKEMSKKSLPEKHPLFFLDLNLKRKHNLKIIMIWGEEMRWERKGNWIPIIFQQLLYKASQLQSLTVGSDRLKNPVWKVKQIVAIMQAQKEFQKEKKRQKVTLESLRKQKLTWNPCKSLNWNCRHYPILIKFCWVQILFVTSQMNHVW